MPRNPNAISDLNLLLDEMDPGVTYGNPELYAKANVLGIRCGYSTVSKFLKDKAEEGLLINPTKGNWIRPVKPTDQGVQVALPFGLESNTDPAIKALGSYLEAQFADIKQRIADLAARVSA